MPLLYKGAMLTLMYILALVGLLVVIRLWIDNRHAFAEGCMGIRPSEKIDCAAVVHSEAGTFLGISNITWGFLFYFSLVLLSVLRMVVAPEVGRVLEVAMAVLVGVGFLYTCYLVWYQHVVLKKYCPLCMASAVTVVALTVVTAIGLYQGYSKGSSFTMVLVTLIFLALVLVQVIPEVVEQKQEARCGYEGSISNWQELLEPDDPSLGNPEAPVVVVEFFDPNCPHCRAFHPQLVALLRHFASEVRFYFKPVALWAYSIPQVEALYAAYRQGKFLEMLEAQYAHAHSGGLTLEELVALAKDIGMDAEALRTDLEEGTYRQKVLETRHRVFSAGVQGVPTLLINGQVVAHTSESMRASCIARLLEETLARQGVYIASDKRVDYPEPLHVFRTTALQEEEASSSGD